MIGLDVIQRIWSLFPPPAVDGTIEARELDILGSPHGRPRLTIDNLGLRHLLIPVPHHGRLAEDKHSAGVHLLTAVWGEGEKRERYIDLVCLKQHLNGLFDLIIYDVLAEIQMSEGEPDRVCVFVLNRWRELLGRDSTPLPEKNEVIGVFGELLMLRDFIRINPLAIQYWTGPERGRYDFFAGGKALEVKTSLQRQGTILTIHGHDQLDPPADGSLHLVILQLEETPADGENLCNLISSIVRLGADQGEMYRKLARLGFFPEILTQLDEQRFKPIEKRVYLVNDEFPRITAASFVNGLLPRGVIAINYRIDLSMPPPHPLSREAVSEVLATW